VKITRATERYEAWLARHLRLLQKDLDFKHRQMRTAPFPFLRATYYRWAQVWAAICEGAAIAPKVLAVGDLHVENFGTWRDVEGRLIWGINDFDEAWQLPYTNDLIRLSTSALMANMSCDSKVAIDAILQGYGAAVEAAGRPFALAEHHPVLRAMATARLHQPEVFWEKLHTLPALREKPQAGAIKALEGMMPERGLKWRMSHRVAGLGSLGRQRYVAVAEWRGGSVAREAKALAPSACFWAEQGRGTPRIHYEEILQCSIRCPDPFVRFQKRWIVRRLAPTVRASSFSPCPRSATNCACCRPWAGKPPTSIWAVPSQERSRPISRNARRAGSCKPRAKWRRPSWPISKITPPGDFTPRGN